MKSPATARQAEWGVVKNLAVPEDYYQDKKTRDAYREIEKQFQSDLPQNGIPDRVNWDFLHTHKPPRTDILAEAWRQKTWHCFKRTLNAFICFADGDHVVESTIKNVFKPWTVKTGVDRQRDEQLTAAWQMRTATSPVGNFYLELSPYYRIMHFCILFLLPFSFILGVRGRDYFSAFCSLTIFAFLMMHALALFNLDRYAVAAFSLGYFLLLRTIFVCFSIIRKKLKSVFDFT